MHTVYDWVTLAIFAAIVVLFLQRSVGPEVPGDRMLNYMPPSIGCAATNYFGNHEQPAIAIALLVATVAYIALVLKPFAPLK